MELHRIVYLYQRWKAKQLSEAERQELRWLLGDERAEQVLKAYWEPEWDAVTAEELRGATKGRLDAVFEAIVQQPQQRAKRKRFTGWRVAAAAVLIAAIGYFALSDRWSMNGDGTLAATEILPGGNRATLTLADGHTITLDEAQTGIIVGTEDITYSDGSHIALSPAGGGRDGHSDGRGRSQSLKLLSLTTPKGGTYQITLPDGSRVWLNAASVLTYPSRFDGGERAVILEGEAYFDIKPDKRTPFSVRTAKQTVEVLGTQFNISAYAEAPETETALVEGSVQVKALDASLQLEPGELGLLAGNTLLKRKADVRQLTAWKNGEFYFKDAPIQAITSQLSKWYDVDFQFAENAPTELFNAMISRDRPLSHVLKLLEETGSVRFRLDGRNVYVSP